MEFFSMVEFKIGFRLSTFSYNAQPVYISQLEFTALYYYIFIMISVRTDFIFPGTLISEKVPHALSRITVINEIPSNKN